MTGTTIPVSRLSVDEAARRLFGRIEDAVRRMGACSMVLAGGESPRPVYIVLSRLLSGRIDPAQLFFFLGDERIGEQGSPLRNETMIRESLFRWFVPDERNVFFWPALPLAPEESALRYAEKIDEFFLRPGRNPDLVLLGLGTDGHTASLFPGAQALVSGRRLPVTDDLAAPAFPVDIPGSQKRRLTLSASFLRSGGETIFLVGGAGKEKAVEALARRERTLPASWAMGKRTEIILLH